MPGHGICSYSADSPDDSPICRYPLAVPELNFVSAPLTAGTCSDPAAPKVPRRADLSPGPSLLDFDPVITVPLSFDDPRAQTQPQHAFLCPGTLLEFVSAKSQGKTRLEVDLKQLTLDRYAIRVSDRSRQLEQPQPIP